MQLRFSLFASFCAVLATACAPADRVGDSFAEHRLTDSAIAALPVLAVSDGPLVCTAIGDGTCPLRSAAANRLDADRIALWEPGAPIRVWRAGDTLGTPIGSTGDDAPYRLAVAVRADGRGFRLITADSGWHLLRMDRDGAVRDRTTLPVTAPLTVVGYVGNQAVRQEMAGWNTGDGGMLTVTLLDAPTDSTGRELLVTPVPWLLGGTASSPPLPPYVAANPAWALNPGNGLAWSPGGEFLVEYRDLSGGVKWLLRGPDGPPVTEADLDVRDAAVREASRLLPFGEEDYAAMRDRSDSLHPAVSSLAVVADGGVIVGLASVPTRGDVEYLRLDATGTPVGRFTLDRRARILLAEGDSLLVHRPTEGEPWEVRWVGVGR